MNRADIPAKFSIPFAASAGVGYVEDIPVLPSPTPGKASLTTGFPPLNFSQIAAGGIPPWGADANGILKWVTLWLQFAQAGGLPDTFDSAFSTSIGGYPQYALLQSASPGSFGKMWLSTQDANTTDPDSPGQTTWVLFPDVLIQRQKNNYAADTGAANTVAIALGITPASWSDIVGMPVRFKALHANTVNNPVISINGLTPATIVNPDGSVLGIGQYTASAICEGTPRDDGKFQLNTPAKQFSPTGTFPIPGFIMPWATETPPSGFVEMNGQLLTISSNPNLWAVLGAKYGGDGINNFRVPDWRGMFVRGWDHGRGLDTGASTRTNRGDGTTGDHVGTNEAGGVDTSSFKVTATFNFAGGTTDGGTYLPVPVPLWWPGSILAGAYEAVNGSPPPGGLPPNNQRFPGYIYAESLPVDGVYQGFGGPASFGYQIPVANWVTTGGVGENRPVNINAMWVIFTG